MYHFFPPPDWGPIYNHYESIKQPYVENMERCLDEIDKQLKSHSREVSRDELAQINRSLSHREFRELFTRKFPDVVVERVEVNVYADKSYSARLLATNNEGKNPVTDINGEEIIPVFISFEFFSGNYDKLVNGTREFREIEYSIPTSEREEAYKRMTGYEGGHKAVAILTPERREYDLFETSHTIVGKYWAENAMMTLFDSTESRESASLIRSRDTVCLQGDDARRILGGTDNMCNLYSIAYFLSRIVCDSHLAIWEYFRRTNHEDLVYLIAGLY